MLHTHYVWRVLLALFLLYCELFSDRELFTNHELQEASTLRYLILLPDTAYTKYRHFGVSHQNEGG